MAYKTILMAESEARTLLILDDQEDELRVEGVLHDEGSVEGLKQCLDDGLIPDVFIKGRSLLNRAVNTGDYRYVSLLLERGASPNLADLGSEETPLMSAASYSVQIFKLLLDAGADPDRVNRNGLGVDRFVDVLYLMNRNTNHIAEKRQLLLERRLEMAALKVDPNVTGQTKKFRF